jgi:hypothetical protein
MAPRKSVTRRLDTLWAMSKLVIVGRFNELMNAATRPRTALFSWYYPGSTRPSFIVRRIAAQAQSRVSPKNSPLASPGLPGTAPSRWIKVLSQNQTELT